jgi:hypothetical protein
MIEGSGSGSILGLNMDLDPGGPKTCGSGGSGTRSATLVELVALVERVAPFLEDLRSQKVPSSNLPSAATYYFSVPMVCLEPIFSANFLHHLANFHFNMGEK